MIVLGGTVRIAPGKKDEAMPFMEKMVAATRAEPGCIQYAFAIDLLDDHLVRIFEVFVDKAALAFHRASPHMAEWRAAIAAGGFIGERDMTQYAVAHSQKI